MENYAYTYPDSGNSSPRSREIDFDNSWEEPVSTSSTGSINHLKAKFMVSYGGKIQPRPHDNQLAYVGGETKILAVDRSIRFSALIAKLSSLFPEAGACGEVSFKYQLPGEDLDALISVTNDDDLDHLVHEYDRLNRTSSKPARLRLFLFSAGQPHTPPPPIRDHAHHAQFGSGDSVKSDRERLFVDALNSGPPPPTAVPVAVAAAPVPAAVTSNNNVDFLFGMEKAIGVGVGGGVSVPPPQMHVVSPPPPPQPKLADPILEPDYGMPDPQIEARIQELNRLQISANQQHHLHQQLQQQQHQLHQHQLQQQLHHQAQAQAQHQQHQHQQQMLYQAKSEENLVNAMDPTYGHRYPDKIHHQHLHPQQQQQQQIPAGYWPSDQKNIATAASGGGGGFQPTLGTDQPGVYMIPATGAVYHAPQVMRPSPQPMTAAPPLQQQQQQPGYYPVQRMQTGEVYRDMPVYGVVSTAPPPTIPATISPQVQKMPGGGYADAGVGGIQQMRAAEMGYAQMAYDSATGRQVYYAAPTGVGSGGSTGSAGGGGGGVPVATPYQVAAAGGGGPAAVVSSSTVVNGGGGEGGRTSGAAEGSSVVGGAKKVSPNSSSTV